MTTEQKNELVAAKMAERTMVAAEITDTILAIADACGMDIDDMTEVANQYFLSGMRGKLQKPIREAEQAFITATRRGKTAVAEEAAKLLDELNALKKQASI